MVKSQDFTHAMAVMSLAASTLFGCSGSNNGRIMNARPKDIQANNKIRKEAGLREIDNTWTFEGGEFGAEKWSRGGPGLCKLVQRDERGKDLVWEEDYYYSGTTFRDPNNGGLVHEMLVIYYDYASKRPYLKYVGQDRSINESIGFFAPESKINEKGFFGVTNKHTYLIADRILAKWGLQRK